MALFLIPEGSSSRINETVCIFSCLILHPGKAKEQQWTDILQVTCILLEGKKMKLQYWQNSGFSGTVTYIGYKVQLSTVPVSGFIVKILPPISNSGIKLGKVYF